VYQIGVDCSVKAVSAVSLLCLACMWCFVSLVLVVRTSAINCLERLIYVSVRWNVKPCTFTHSVLIISGDYCLIMLNTLVLEVTLTL